MKFLEPPMNSSITSRDPSLIKLVAKAHLARMGLEKAKDLSVAEIASAQGISSDYFRVLIRISYLAPDIVAAILEGRQPVQLNRQRLARATSLPIDWHDQREALGFS
jgi:site-specific DNA recombinase